MQTRTIKESLRSWIQIETWHTGHALDDQRFHASLHAIFNTHGTSFPIGDFEEALNDLIGELYPTWELAHKEASIAKYTLQAECICCYLDDAKTL